jgi:transposase
VNGAEEADLVVGAGTHLDTHTAAICDARGRAVSQMQVPATTAGYGQLLAWVSAAAADRQVVWAVEGTRHYGLGLARYLTSQGQQVSEIDCSRHVGKRRAGKSDPIDAVRDARELLARPHPAQMRADGDREALPPADHRLRPAPPHRRKDRQGNPPLPQALPRPPPLPHPQQELTNMEAS